MRKVFTLFSIILLLLLSFSISADEKPSLFWFGEDSVNYLSSTQQEYVCENWDFINSFDTIWYYTDTNILCFGNYYRYNSSSSAPYRFNNLYWLESDGTFSRENAMDSGVDDPNDVGAIYKSDGAFDVNIDNLFIINECYVSTPPSLILPPASVPEYSVDTEQDVFINSYGSPAIKGGRVVLHEIDYYNIYSVVQSAQTDEFFNSRNENYFIYQKTNDSYIFAVYDHSELQVYAPNMNVSNSRIDLTDYLLGDFSYVYVTSDSNIIQRDVSSFSLKYIDALKSRLYGYEQLPFNDSEDNKNHLEYLGVKSESNYVNSSSASLEVAITTEYSDYLLYFVVTDKYDDIQMGININNQTIIDNSLQHGNSLTQGSKNNLDNANSSLNSTINQYNQLDQQANQDLIDDLNAIDLNDFAINGLFQLSNSSNFVRTQFNNLTANNPIGTSVGFALVVGLSLLLLAKRL